MEAGNLLLSAGILFTGNTFSRVCDIASLINLQFFCETEYLRIRDKYLFPVINMFWEEEKNRVIFDLKQQTQNVTLCEDGRCDSPGYSAKYCTYTFMDMLTDKICDFELVHCKQTSSSVAMEKHGFKIILDRSLDEGISVDTVATDGHIGIKALMRNNYKHRGVDHQLDIWHVPKGVCKKLTAKAKQKECKDLFPWIKSVTNHLWWCAQTCRRNATLLKEKWISILYHITNQHSWGTSILFTKCKHGDLSRQE